MIMKKSFNIAGCFLLGFLTLNVSGQNESRNSNSIQSDFTKRRSRIVSQTVTYNTISRSFCFALSSTGVPGGIIENSPSCPAHDEENQPAYPDEASLQERLNTIIQTNPGYHWQIENGVVNLSPISEEPELMKIRIRQFHAENVGLEVLQQLKTHPEVQKYFSENSLNPPQAALMIGGLPPKSVPFSVHCENATVREILNAIVKAHGKAIWSYQETRCNGEGYYSLYFLVQ